MIENLFDPVTKLKGVGTKTAEALASLSIYSIYDLLFYFPYRYDDLEMIPLDQLEDGQKVLLKGIVATEPFLSRFGYKKSRLSFKLRIDHDIIMVNFFNQPWLKNQLEIGKELAVYGKYSLLKQSLSAFKIVASRQDSDLSPVYPVNRHIKQKKLIDLIKLALNELPDVEDIIPQSIRSKYKLLSDQELVKWMHQPASPKAAKFAKRSAMFREFFLFQVQLAQLSMNPASKKAPAKKYSSSELDNLAKTLPFELSPDQKKVINEILSDMGQAKQMRRLLQGDVGSGKTVVAEFAIYAAITAGYQAALMVPTEILANQHFNKIANTLAQFGVRVALLTSSTKTMEKREIYRELTDGTLNVVIGTHALIQANVSFKKLGLVIIDEQHRFGVNQRQKLIAKGDNPDVLAMTATPIPRTLALTAYGEMDVSEIRHLPAGRKPIVSKWVTTSHLDEVLAKMKEQLAAGFQIYVVTPLIEESENIDLKNAKELSQKLANYFKDEQVVLLHGQMAGDEKDDIMTSFAAGQIQILVATSVIEVGVDVPNANMMVIFDADRFGLSQLHQLRGRIGRGQTESYCYFVADPKTEIGKKRMQIISTTSNGFKLSEEDLKLRGQGDLFGKAQSGLPEFRQGDLVNDYNAMVVAQELARAIIKKDPNLNQNPALKAVIAYNKKIKEID
ncbi:ATP-dependent DNA helicase RecG [Lactobacillus psittaci]|uniref:ATP-dependent DNA helicase RecG n=1 Tax=Lactobacillus psittaci DSM 15354 TaxID=1122152 RepID=A0A0R1S4P3_9LACO|nr:ATP-dependent DNA helicase RecG [Lactobacillus psittaci]KRL63984.1 ATP-dependent DNA helicase RecG [Lactobacillus psittaci DSM 15354]